MKINWNTGWKFTKDLVAVTKAETVMIQGAWEDVDLPHTWNGVDGQDGGNDYYRGTCFYTKQLKREELPEGTCFYLEFEGANSSADLYINGEKAAHHDGGYSTWRACLTPYLQEENEIVVAVDNAPNDRVYPQMADFTFYGGLYRDVSLIGVGEVHFDLDNLGGPAIAVTPEITGECAKVKVDAWVCGAGGTESIVFEILGDGQTVAASSRLLEAGQGALAQTIEAQLIIPRVHLWHGRKDPYLYTLRARIMDHDSILDERTVRFGCRTFVIDPERGFFLNGKSYPLRGVSRHQDRPKIGNALQKEHHDEDMKLILELGATTIRLAHYQHDQHFYDLCDENGIVVWAEIPYISQHMPGGRENTISQMKELIVQNYNHPSIVVWGLSNEITMKGATDPDLIENHRILNDLCHEMDKTRKTAIAVVSMCGIDEAYVRIPDVVSYNHYFGWYGGDTSMNGPFMDEFHARYPDEPIGMSEYGCEALNWHTSHPEQGDYTEEYQAYYHEELIKQLFTRPFIWATHVWNMFDFAADARAEGGEDGMNHKGLVTFDRKYKKDAFYAYKAWLSDELFVHICGKRYVDRVEDVTKVTVYSNLPEVELLVNGKSLGRQACPDHFFYFDVPNRGESELLARAYDKEDEADLQSGGSAAVRACVCEDTSRIRKVDTFNEAYRMKETGDVLNWFEITAPEGYFSINDRIGDIMESPEGRRFFAELMEQVADNMETDADGKPKAMGFTMTDDMMKMMNGFTLKRMFSLFGTAGAKPVGREQMLEINQKLNQIRKEKEGA